MVNTERKDWWKIHEERVALRKGWSTEGTDGIYIEEDRCSYRKEEMERMTERNGQRERGREKYKRENEEMEVATKKEWLEVVRGK